MSLAIPTQPSNSDLNRERFPSLTALRVTHADLLKRYHQTNSGSALNGEIEQFMLRGRETGSILDNEEERWTAQGMLDYWTTVLYRSGHVKVPDTTLLDFDAALAPELSDELCPYLGLDAFRADQQHLFFGRQRLLKKLLQHVETHRILMVVGSSGSGKSSVVLGGLLPRLQAGALSQSEQGDSEQGDRGQWHYPVPLVPGSDPLRAIAKRFQPTNISKPFSDNSSLEQWLSQQVTAFKADSTHLLKLVSQCLEPAAKDAPSPKRPTVLFIDQFEEIFTLCRDQVARTALVNNLIAFAQATEPENRLIVTMRTDFESQLVRLPGMVELFEEAHVRVTALEAAELREAITQPAALIGLKFEEGLVDALLMDVLGEPAALPLLQFTLVKLWEQRDHNRMTWAAYRELGGGRAALKHCADEFFDQLMIEDQEAVKRILLKMARPTAGLEVTSNRVPRLMLYEDGIASDRIDRVLQRLIDERLVRLTKGATPQDDQVEIAHEALIRNWPRLIDWLTQDKANLQQRLRLTDLVNDWQQRKRPTDLLLQGQLLAEATRYRDLSELEKAFVQASRQHVQRKARRRQQLKTAFAAAVGIAFGSSVVATVVQIISMKNIAAKSVKLEDQSVKLEDQRVELKDQRVELEAQRVELRAAQDELENQIQRREQATLTMGASEFERQGFDAILSGDLTAAQAAFGEAVRRLQSDSNQVENIHQVESIYSQVLTLDLLDRYSRASSAEEKGEILREVFTQIVNIYKYSEGAPPAVIAQMDERLNGVIVYYQKDVDGSIVSNALSEGLAELGFKKPIESLERRNNEKTNALWFGRELSTETIKTVVTTLIDNHVPIQAIRPYLDNSEQKARIIQLGHDPEVTECPEWMEEDLESAILFTRENDGCTESD